jgi:hypothetical protein
MSLKKLTPLILGLTLTVSAGLSQSGTASKSAGTIQEQPSIPVDEIIRKFAEKEKQFKIARAAYTYQQDVKVQELDGNDRVRGEFNQVSEITFDSAGKRIERIVRAPRVTLERISMSAQDLQDLREIQPFVLTADDIQKYDLKYQGKEKIDEIECYVFDVSPKKIEKDQRYFEGKIWVDDQDLQIVKTYGKAVPDIKKKGEENLFPKFETYREQVDEYWFPTYTRAVDTLQFSTGPVRMREIIKYDKYKKFQADVKLSYGDVVDENGKPTGTGVQEPKKAKALDPKMGTDPKTDPKKKP